MIKNIKRNQRTKFIPRKSIYEQEMKLTHELLASDDENIEIEYYTVNEARNARTALKRKIAQARQPLEVHQNKKFLYIIKKTEGEGERSQDCRKCKHFVGCENVMHYAYYGGKCNDYKENGGGK